MAPREEIPFPFQGRSDGTAKGKQSNDTTSDAKNVVGWIPSTEQMQGGQRAGLSPFVGVTSANNPVLDATNPPIQHGLTVNHDRPAFDYVSHGKTLAEQGTGDYNNLSQDWAFTSFNGQETSQVRVDLERNSYWLSDGLVIKRNADGELLFRVPVPVTGAQEVAKSMVIDLDDNIYVAVQSANGSPVSAVVKFAPREDDKSMDLKWIANIQMEKIASMVFEFGRILVACNTPGANREAALWAIDDLAGDEPAVIRGADVPYPVNDVATGPAGTYVACLPADERGPSDIVGGFVPSEVDWHPHDMANSEERLHFWLDATEVGYYHDGARVNSWPDRRFVEPLRSVDDGTPAPFPLDESNRRLFAYHDTDWSDEILSGPQKGRPEGPLAPRYSASAAQAMPGLVFDASEGQRENNTSIWRDGGTGLWSEAPEITASFPLRTDKVLATGSLAQSYGLWPITDSHHAAIHLVFRWKAGAPPSVVWAGTMVNRNTNSAPPGGNIAVVVNFDAADHIATGGPGGSTHSPTNNLGSTQDTDDPRKDWDEPYERAQKDGVVTLIQDNHIIAYGDATFDRGTTPPVAGTEETRMAIVTIILERDAASADQFRVNGQEGTHYDTVTTPWRFIDDNITRGREVIGSRVYYEEAQPANTSVAERTYWILPNIDSFSGSLHELLSYHSDSTGGPVHGDDMATTFSGSDPELVEGYLAHKWGCAANVLADGHAYEATVPSGVNGLNYEVNIETKAALTSRHGILAKVDPNLSTIQWAISGAGMGYGVETDRETGVFCTGPRLATLGSDDLGPQARTLLKANDRGLAVDWTRPSIGKFVIHKVPLNSTTITITDQENDHTFRFSTVSLATHNSSWPNETWIDVSGGDADTIGADLETKISTKVGIMDLDIYAKVEKDADGYPQPLHLYSRLKPDLTERLITTTCAAAELTVEYGMSGPGFFATNVWELRVEEARQLTNTNIQMAVDLDENVYVPMSYTGKQNHLVKYASESHATDGGVAKELWTHIIDNITSAYAVNAVVVDPVEVDLWPAVGPGSLWVATSNYIYGDEDDISLTENTQRRIRAVREDPFRGPARQTTTLAVAGGNLYQVTQGDTLTDTDGTSTSHGSVAGTDSIWIQSAVLFGEVFFCDAGTYKVYNLKKDTVRDYVVVGSGQMPEGSRLITAYRGRVVMGRAKEDAHNIHASAQGDPYNWYLGAASDDPTRAFSGSKSGTAKSPDIVNALAPFFDDRLIIGGDSSISVFSGDLSELGRADLFTDATGMAFGATYALDPSGYIYFFGSRGGIWAMSPTTEGRGQPPVELTEQTIAAELGRLDLAVYRPHLVWDQEQRALYVYIVRRDSATPAAIVQQWMYEKRSKAWWPIVVDDTSKQPTAAWIADGDLPNDRVHVIGCEDGRVRFWNPDAVWDDGTRIDSSVLLGPLNTQDSAFEAKLTSLEITLAEGAVRYEVYTSDNPAKMGNVPVATGRAGPGFSGSLRHRARGGSIWIKLYNASDAETWRLESVFADIGAAGRRRVR